MFGLSTLSRAQRLVLGIFVLLLVDIIWVASSELTEYLFVKKTYGKPYFGTYVKSSMFIIYLGGFIVWRSWWLQCHKSSMVQTAHEQQDKGEQQNSDAAKLLSDPIYVPVKNGEKSNSSTDSEDCTNGGPSRSVRFSNLSEVRQLSESHAEEAVLARLSYSAYIRLEESRLRAAAKLTVKQIAKMSGIFCIIFFFCHLSFQEAVKDTAASNGIVNILSSTSGLFTLILAAIFPSSTGDRFTLSKFVAVALSIGGIVLVSFSDTLATPEVPIGALWALLGALLYAIYLVLLRRRVDNEDKLNIPMFFGFVGLFTMILLWPGFFIIHFSKAETFEWPDEIHWIFLVINGIIGTVISELLWLWGCFLTSSLVATLAISLTVPMTMIADIVIKDDVKYNWMFYVGTGPVFLAFFAVTILSHYDNWDPVLLAVKKLIQCICRRRLIPRLRDLDREQTESLIGINNGHGES